jgi:hypothetical protein
MTEIRPVHSPARVREVVAMARLELHIETVEEIAKAADAVEHLGVEYAIPQNVVNDMEPFAR